MSSTNSSSNRVPTYPRPRRLWTSFKMEVATELACRYQRLQREPNLYQNGFVGGYMVKKMIEAQEKTDGWQVKSMKTES